NAPYLLPNGRDGERLGHSELIDSMIHDGLWCAFDDRHMGAGTDAISAELGITRQEQDAWAERSHRRAEAAWDDGKLAEEVAPVEVAQKEGPAVSFHRDDGIRPDTSAERLARLTTDFTPEGTVTAAHG